MKLSYLAVAVVVAALPVSSYAQQGGGKATNAMAKKVVAIISADKAKVKIYCDLSTLSDQADEAEKKKDTKQVDEISKKMDEMSEKLGPEYVALSDGMDDLDPNSKEAQAIDETLGKLDDMCGD